MSDYESFMTGKRVVLVGPAASLAGRGRGREIDAYDVVVRLNLSSPVTPDLYDDIGSRTDVLYHVLFNDRLARAAKRDHGRAEMEAWKADGVKFIVTRQEARHERIKRFQRKTRAVHNPIPLVPMTREFKAGVKAETGTNPNTGTLAIAHLLSLPIASLYVTGFDFYATGYHVGYGGFTAEQAAKGRGGRGAWGQRGTDTVPHEQSGQMAYLARLAMQDARLIFDDVASGRLGIGKIDPTITALVPMKGHSERVPNKNIRPLNGLPLLTWALGALHQARHISRVVVDTDSEHIADLVRQYHPRTDILMRPERLRGDHVTGNDLIEWELSQVEGEHFGQFHVTSPLLTPATIDRAIEAYFEGGHDSLFTVTEHHCWLFDEEGKPLNSDPRRLVRSQDLAPIYEDNHAAHLFSRASFEATRSRIGVNPRMFPIPKLEAVDIDEEDDFVMAEALMRFRHA